jgi:hypothetical protein
MLLLPDEEQPRHWVASERPPRVCPRRYCFHFVGKGLLFAPGRHANLAEALDAAKPVAADHCAWPWGTCGRLGLNAEDRDYYEPHEPALEQSGLPWFYFIASLENLIPEMHEEYLAGVAALWGPE